MVLAGTISLQVFIVHVVFGHICTFTIQPTFCQSASNMSFTDASALTLDVINQILDAKRIVIICGTASVSHPMAYF
jgi:hypothetical protein